MPCNAANEAHWRAIADRYALEPGPINLENGYFGRMSRAVQAQYLEHVAFINRSNAVHVRQRFEQGENVEIRRQLAELIDADPESVAFTSNATEALQSLIRNYNLFTTTRSGAAFGTCIRVTPGLATSTADIHALINAITALSAD